MSLTENLSKLFLVDRQVRGLQSRLDSAKRYYDNQSRQLDEIDATLLELQTRSRHLKAVIANHEGDGAALDEQLEKFRRDLNSAATNKQYTAVLTELNTVKEARSKVDDGILAEMESSDQLEVQIGEVKQQREERARVREIAKTQLDEREGEIGERLAELESEREEAASAIPSDVLSIFDKMADAHDGEAIADVEEIDRRNREYACGECNMHMPFEQISSLMGSTDELVRCTACGRILLLKDEVRGALAPK